jgi:hypothetical protein
MYTLWYTYWTHRVQIRIFGGPNKYCRHLGYGGPHFSSRNVHNIRTYRVLQMLYPELCSDYGPNGKIVAQGY